MNLFESKNKEEYYLLNKDEILATFHVDDEIDMPIIDRIIGEIPSWITNLSTFIINRRAPKSRENITELLKISGCDTLRGYLDITHALSLIDTFWVKSINSKLEYSKISLYIHPFNETIAKAAFEGGLRELAFSSTSPEYGTDGTFAKCWIRENNVIKMLKRGSTGARNVGLEPYSEFYASQVIANFTQHYVDYGLRTHKSKICSVCDCFTSEKYGYLPYAAIDKGNTDFLQILDIMEKYGLADKARLMFVVDAVIFNEDRHKNNFGFIVDNDKQEIVDMAPLFDHNISLLPYAEKEEFADLDNYLSQRGPRLGNDFFSIAKYCLTPTVRNTLINLLGFKFKRHPKYNLPEWRLNCLEKFVNENIKKILA